MKDIVQTSTSAVWREVETVEEAMRIGKITQTAFGIYFSHEQTAGVKNRHFALGNDFSVIGCVPLEPRKYRINSAIGPANGLPLFVGHKNGDPFPAYQCEIAELARALGAEITSAHYPYRRSDVDLSDDNQDDGPCPGM
jgi:hypothetical protein